MGSCWAHRNPPVVRRRSLRPSSAPPSLPAPPSVSVSRLVTALRVRRSPERVMAPPKGAGEAFWPLGPGASISEWVRRRESTRAGAAAGDASAPARGGARRGGST